MRKSLIYVSALALTLGLASCENEEVVNGPESNGGFDTNYLSINLVQSPDMGTRAGEYEDGDEMENAVSKVRFYFFDGAGNAAGVKKAGESYQNYYDWTNPSKEDGTPENVEKKLKAVLIINTKAGDKLPAQVVAILNPEKANLGDGNLSLSDLRDKTKANDFASFANAKEDQVFVMGNSVYANEGKTETLVATPITAEYYASSSEDAINNPVNIYVERNVAKVRVSFGDNVGYDSKTGLIELKDKDNKALLVDGKQVYLKVGKWDVTAETEKGNLLKSITTPSWNVFGNVDWNKPEYFRSFWANNVENVGQVWHSYDDFTGDKATRGKSVGSSLENSIYTNENAPSVAKSEADIDKFTKVIMAGTLGTLEGEEFKPLTITKFAGVTAVGKEALIISMLNSLGSNTIYSYTTSADNTTFTQIGENDVELVTAKEAGVVNDGELNKGHYYVYLKLSEIGAKKNWSKSDKNDSLEQDKFTGVDDVNKHLATYGVKGQIYDNGMTYYYFPIKHLGEVGKVGDYGVVRNHIYDCNITRIAGLGTPVYNPKETIWPETPVDEDTYIAAQINILSWRIVSNEYELVW